MTAPVKQLMRVVLIVKTVLGFSMGVYEATCGAYFYDRFGGSLNSSTALMLAMILLAARQGLITLLEMPTGALADTIGRVQVVVISLAGKTIFFVCLASMWFCSSVATVVAVGAIASLFWAIYYASFNGAFSAWCVDYLKENAPEYPYSLIASRGHSCFMTSVAIGTPVGIIFYLQGYPALIYAFSALLCILCMGYCLFRVKENRSNYFVDRDHVTSTIIFNGIRERLWESCTACWKRPILFWIVMTFGAFIFLLNIVEFIWPIFLKETTGATEWSWIWIGLAVGCSIISALSSRLFVWVSSKIALFGSPTKRLMFFSWIFTGISVISAILVVMHGYATAHLVNSFTLLVITIITIISGYGVMGPCFETIVNHYIGEGNDRDRATIISCGSFIRGLLFVFLAVPSAGSSAAESPIYWVIPASLLLISASVSLVMLLKVDRNEAAAVAPI